MTFLWFHDNPTPHNYSVLYSRCYNPFPFQRTPAPVADTSARLSPLAAQVQLLQQSLFLSSEHLVSQRTQCEKISGQAPIFFPVSSFCPASIWSRSGRSVRKSPVKLPFSSSLFPLSVQRAFGLAADAVRTFPVEHLRFLFLSSEHLVSQRTQ